ncbi:alpha-ketoglutarate-dependent dioxygenase AlkB [Fodinicola acaciae]|uniref:alpha-ketoglutarate-dependent dioxygenase AlkB n=1 Tax=Fodinicola acaciae TaxID=2681555 RepID=UPI0013D30B00|nr:alpha-ketoglutarate-dependent dioxygenase AlkB [Fodinicola acaciae]
MTTQPDLFGVGDTLAIDETFATAHRIELDATSWVEHVPGWLTGNEVLLERLIATAEWEQRERRIVDRMMVEPRLTAEYPDVRQAPEPMLHTITAVLSEHYGVPYDGLWINYYRDHRDSTGWHGDWATCKRRECVVPVLSLGATRRFLVKPRKGGRSVVLTPAGGDLVVMGGRCQRDWRHCVPKQQTVAGARISVNFSSRFQAAGD